MLGSAARRRKKEPMWQRSRSEVNVHDVCETLLSRRQRGYCLVTATAVQLNRLVSEAKLAKQTGLNGMEAV